MGAINKINVNGITYDILGLPVGTIFTSALPQTNSGVHLLDGSYIAINGIYSDFCKLVKELANQYPLLCSEEEYNNDLNLTGNCGKFVLYENDKTLKLPTITTFIQGLTDLTNIGNSVEAGLPNITGSFKTGTYEPWASVSGAFTKTAVSGTIDDSTNKSYNNPMINLDASRSSPIYGNSETVQPPSVKYPYYIVLATVKQTDIEVNIDNITNDLNNKMDKPSIKRYVTETWISSDELSWYTIYNDGWKECGGIAKRNVLCIYPSIVFVNNPLILCTYQTSTSISSSDSPIKIRTSDNTSGFIWETYHSYDVNAYYYACGY